MDMALFALPNVDQRFNHVAQSRQRLIDGRRLFQTIAGGFSGLLPFGPG